MLFKEVICDLAAQWSHGSVVDEVRRALVVIRPGVRFLCSSLSVFDRAWQIFPNIYAWVTFGLTSLMLRIIAEALPTLQASSTQQASPFLTECMAVIERTFNFAHTGSSKVLVRRVMDPMWLSLGIKFDTFPVFAPLFHPILESRAPLADTLLRIWPLRPGTFEPLTTSKRAHVLNFSNNSWHVRVLYRSPDVIVAYRGLHSFTWVPFA